MYPLTRLAVCKGPFALVKMASAACFSRVDELVLPRHTATATAIPARVTYHYGRLRNQGTRLHT